MIKLPNGKNEIPARVGGPGCNVSDKGAPWSSSITLDFTTSDSSKTATFTPQVDTVIDQIYVTGTSGLLATGEVGYFSASACNTTYYDRADIATLAPAAAGGQPRTPLGLKLRGGLSATFTASLSATAAAAGKVLVTVVGRQGGGCAE